MKILAIIPARSGSKGLKDKNIKPLNGIPLCAYSIKAAVASGVFDEIHFSTDSQLYAEIACSYGASVPFLRCSELSTDTASSWAVVEAVIKEYARLGRNFDAMMLLQPTVPLRSAEDIVAAVDLLKAKNANAIVSVTDPDHSPLLCAPLPESGLMDIYHERFSKLVARQKMEKSYILNGAIYLAKIPYVLNAGDIYEDRCYAYHMPRERSFDIDTQEDFDWCEYRLQKAAEKI